MKLPLANFRALHPHLAASPESPALTDVYAATVKEHASQAINPIELVEDSRGGDITDPRRFAEAAIRLPSNLHA